MRQRFSCGISEAARLGLAGRGVTQRTIAALVGVPRETVSRVLGGSLYWRPGPKVDRILRAVELILAEPPEAFIRDREGTLIRVARKLAQEELGNHRKQAAAGG